MNSVFSPAPKRGVDLTPVQEFDLKLYLGLWHEIARFDHRFERGLGEVTALYRLQDNGMITVTNAGLDTKRGKRRTITGKAKTTATKGLLRVSFFLWFYSNYIVLALGENYEWALVGAGKSDKYLWILSRSPKLEEEKRE